MSNLDFVFNTGAAWTDLLGTVRHPYAPHALDRLTDPERLAVWLTAVGFAPSTTPTDDDLAHVRGVREALGVYARHRLGRKQTPGAPELDAATASLRAAVAIDPEGLLDLADAPTGDEGTGTGTVRLDAALSAIVASALADLAHHPGDFGACCDPDCGKLFLDVSHTRKACCDTCSTRIRVRAYREKVKSA